MKFLQIFGLCCQLILSTHSDHKSSALKEEKTQFGNLPDGPVQEIFGHLDKKDQEHLSKTASRYIKFDPSYVYLNLPLKRSKKPTDFVCEHLKTRKKLVVSLNEEFTNLEADSLELKYLHCLSGIENIVFSQYAAKSESIILADSNFKLETLFPKLQHMQVHLDDKVPLNAIPNNLKSLGMYYFQSVRYSHLETIWKEKIAEMIHLEKLTLDISDTAWDTRRNPLKDRSLYLSPMIAELKRLPKFERLSININGYFKSFNDLIAQTKHAKYFFDLGGRLKDDFHVGDFIQDLPGRTEKLVLDFNILDENEKVCAAISNLKHLKELSFNTEEENDENFDCLLQSLPSTLTKLYFYEEIETSDVEKITLPKGLQKVSLKKVRASIFEALANQAVDLSSAISDPENIMMIQKPFRRVKSLTFREIQTTDLNVWDHLFDLLPHDMDYVSLAGSFNNEEEIKHIEEKILSLNKKITYFDFKTRRVGSNNGYLLREFIFDGSRMIKKGEI